MTSYGDINQSTWQILHLGIYDISARKIRHNLRLMSRLFYLSWIETRARARIVLFFLLDKFNASVSTLSVALRNGKRAARFSRSNDLRRERLVITLDNGQARDNPCKYAKPSNCKQSNLNVTLAAADVYLSCRVSTVLHVCATDKEDGVSPENEFHNCARSRHASTYNSYYAE